MSARTHCTMECDFEVFKTLVAPHAASVTPEKFHREDSVIVAIIEGSESIGNVFGESD